MGKFWYNPFEKYAGWQAFSFGLIAIIITTYLGALINLSFDGVISIHFREAPVYVHFASILISILTLALVLYLAGLKLSTSKIRFIDVLGTSFMARIPFLFIPLLVYVIPVQEIGAEIASYYQTGADEITISTIEWIKILLVAFVMLGVIVWYIALLYNAFKVSCNITGAKATISLIIAIIVSEIISKLCLIFIFDISLIQ